MRLTESNLKQLIIEEYETALFEASMPEFDVSDLVVKAKKMKKNNQSPERELEEGGGLFGFAFAGFGLALALPKIIQWCAKLTKFLVKKPMIKKAINAAMGPDGALAVEDFAQSAGKWAHGLHEKYLGFIEKYIVGGISKIQVARGKKPVPEEKRRKLAEAIFMILLAIVAIYAAKVMSAGAGSTALSKAMFSTEALTTSIKAFEISEYAGYVPAALAFLKVGDEFGHH